MEAVASVKHDWAAQTYIRRLRRCFPDKAMRDEAQAIVELAMEIGNLTADPDKPWNVIAGHIEALRLARGEMERIKGYLHGHQGDGVAEDERATQI